MDIYIGDKIKELRNKKGISQEKMAQYLNVSFQSVSKWENGNSYPDISLLPEIARFFGVTVDELLQVEKLDEQKVYAEYEQRACDYYRNGNVADELTVWQEAYHAMPNNLDVKEKLLASYYDFDKVKYQKEIVDLGTEIYEKTLTHPNEERGTYLRGQVVEMLSKTFADTGNVELAERWAVKANYLMHAQEFLFTQITKGKELLSYFRFANYWYFKNLFYMACRVADDEELSDGEYGQELFQTLCKLYEIVYPDGDMEFEMLGILCILHRSISEDEAGRNGREEVIQEHLEKALWYAQKSLKVKNHKLSHPLVRGFEVYDAPTDNKKIVRTLKSELMWDCFKDYRDKAWFINLEKKINNLLKVNQ